MNLSQILNPPGPAIATLASGRSPSPSLPSLAHATPTAPLSRKHSSSVSVARLEDQESATRSSTSNITAVTNTNNTITVPPQKIKPNEINNGYSTHTFRANPPPLQAAKDLSTPYSYGASFNSNSNITNSIPATSASASAPVTASGTAAPGAGSGMPGQMVMRYNLSQDIAPSSSASTAKKKPRSQIESPFAFHDSFHATPTDQSESKPTSAALKKKHLQKGSPASSTLPETESQPLEIRFVMTDKDGQDRNKAQKPASSMSAPHAPSPPLDTQTEDTTVQESSHGTPHFEKNADGKFRCSWPRCGKEFTVASRLTTHYRIHSGKPPYLCGYKDCQKAFHTSSSLSHHRVVHTDQGLRPYVCRHNRCGATYTQLARLITHQRTTHSGMILFIPQEASSSSSSAASPSQSQVQSQPPSINTTPSGTPRDDPLSTYHPLTSIPNATETHDFILGTAGSSSPTSGEHIKKTNDGGRRLSGSPPSEELLLDVQSDMVITRTQPRAPSDFDKAQPQYTSRLLVEPFDSGVLSEHAPRNNFRSGYLDSAEGRILATNDRRAMDQEEEESDEMRQRKEAALTMTTRRRENTGEKVMAERPISVKVHIAIIAADGFQAAPRLLAHRDLVVEMTILQAWIDKCKMGAALSGRGQKHEKHDEEGWERLQYH
ncbi:hypothetical protein BGZ98_004277 [Dissophora globulifera]|nr:hypothetical protein BGZ98_004277 [Dissophora globulifera]